MEYCGKKVKLLINKDCFLWLRIGNWTIYAHSYFAVGEYKSSSFNNWKFGYITLERKNN